MLVNQTKRRCVLINVCFARFFAENAGFSNFLPDLATFCRIWLLFAGFGHFFAGFFANFFFEYIYIFLNFLKKVLVSIFLIFNIFLKFFFRHRIDLTPSCPKTCLFASSDEGGMPKPEENVFFAENAGFGNFLPDLATFCRIWQLFEYSRPITFLSRKFWIFCIQTHCSLGCRREEENLD